MEPPAMHPRGAAGIPFVGTTVASVEMNGAVRGDSPFQADQS